MNELRRATIAAVLPYAVWMVLMFGLEPTAVNYALRTGLTAAALSVVAPLSLAPFTPWCRFRQGKPVPQLLWGVLVGLVVCFLWIWPEQFAGYRDFNVLGFLGFGAPAVEETSPYAPETCGWALTWTKLVGSAFIIAPVEELFFRSLLYRWLQKGDWTKVDLAKFDLSAFVWMVGIFALEHHTRLAAGAMAGALYGFLAIRKGLGSAVIAHVVTNLVLGLYVIRYGQWGFW